MNFIKSFAKKSVLIGLVFFLSNNHTIAQNGQQIFQQNCATCHALDKVITGPALRGVTERGPWTDKNNIHHWVHNPGAFIPTTPYTQALQKTYGQIMPSFPQLKDEEIDAIVKYIETAPAANAPKPGAENTAAETEASSNTNAVIFGIISLVLALFALILMQVNSNLKNYLMIKKGSLALSLFLSIVIKYTSHCLLSLLSLLVVTL